MKTFLFLLGLYFVLWVPYLGHIIQHAFGHVTAHHLDHHETAFAAGLVALFWLLVLALIVTVIFGFGWLFADMLLSFLILFRLFGGGH